MKKIFQQFQQDKPKQYHKLEEKLQQTQKQLENSKHYIQQLKTERDHLQEQLQQSQQTYQQLQQLQTERDQYLLKAHKTQEDLEQTFFKLQKLENKVVNFYLKEKNQITSVNNKEYNFLVWNAWDAYNSDKKQQMVNYLQLSLQYTPFSRTETILDWLNCFSNFAKIQEKQINIKVLTDSLYWKKLIEQVTAITPNI